MAIKKSHIIEHLYERLGLPKSECGDIVDRFLKIIKESLADGDDVKLSGLGLFMVKTKKARKGRNPQTGDKMVIAERKVVRFKLSEVLKDKMNGGRGT